MDVMERIQKQVDSAAIVLYMKGTPQFPQCGFSSTAAQTLASTGVEFGCTVHLLLNSFHYIHVYLLNKFNIQEFYPNPNIEIKKLRKSLCPTDEHKGNRAIFTRNRTLHQF
jgi:hypothetical protein